MTLIRGTQTSLSTIGRKAWLALRFVLFGLGGLWLLTIFSFEFIAGVRRQPNTASFISPLLALPIALVGALMMLFAVGGWGQWAYLWVILSIPITLLLVTTCPAGRQRFGYWPSHCGNSLGEQCRSPILLSTANAQLRLTRSVLPRTPPTNNPSPRSHARHEVHQRRLEGQSQILPRRRTPRDHHAGSPTPG